MENSEDNVKITVAKLREQLLNGEGLSKSMVSDDFNEPLLRSQSDPFNDGFHDHNGPFGDHFRDSPDPFHDSFRDRPD